MAEVAVGLPVRRLHKDKPFWIVSQTAGHTPNQLPNEHQRQPVWSQRGASLFLIWFRVLNVAPCP